MTANSLVDTKLARPYQEEVEMVFTAIDCVLNGEKAVYCSSELTSGARLYEVLLEHGLKSAAELRQKLGDAWLQKNIFDINVRAATAFAEFVRGTFRDKTMIVAPAPFSAPGWSQPEYLSFWEILLQTRIKGVWFNRNWQFSNGCTFELAVAQECGLFTFDHEGDVLDRFGAMELIEKAIKRLAREGFDTEKLSKNLERLQSVRSMASPQSSSNKSSH
jgi:hypothetical protein